MDMGMYEYPPPSPACLESLGEVIVRGKCPPSLPMVYGL
jgi:hypothetical protein